MLDDAYFNIQNINEVKLKIQQSIGKWFKISPSQNEENIKTLSHALYVNMKGKNHQIFT